MDERVKVFYCYSPNLKNELIDTGERFIVKAVHPKTQRYYWVFIKTDTLIKYLDKRPKFKDGFGVFSIKKEKTT
jgi:hypothetical protein